MRRVPYIEQMTHSECGLACIAMILGFYKHHTTLAELRTDYYASKNGLSFLEIKHIAEDFNLISKIYEIDGSVSMLDDKALFPCILHWDINHFVVLEKIKKRTAIILDPVIGRRKITIEELDKYASGYMMTFEGGEQLPRKKKVGYFNFLFSFVARYKLLFSLLLISSIVFTGITLFVPLVTRWATDRILVPRSSRLLPILGIFVMSLATTRFLLSVIRGYIVTRFQKHLDKALMTHFIEHLLKLPYSFFEDRSKGDLLYRANSNVQIRDILSERIVSTIVDGLLIVGLMIGMLLQSGLLGTIVITCSILILLTLFLTTNITRQFTNQQVSTQTETQSVLSEQFNSMTDIKGLGLEVLAYEEWKQVFNKQIHVFEKTGRWTTWLNAFSSTIQFIMPLLILWIGSYQVIKGSITFGTVLATASMASIYLMPIVSVSSGYMQIIFLSSILQRLYDVLAQTPSEKKTKPSTGSDVIKFDKVSFSYGRMSEPVLKNINLTIREGQKVVIVGASGSGKSTLVKLITGLYQPRDGELYLSSESIGAVLQESKLFNRSILDNITIGFSDYHMEDVMHAAKIACIHQEISALPMKYQTIIAENGNNLSGGQRQRIILARIIFRKPKVLILDEATSALNEQLERKVSYHLKRHFPTQIIISHQETWINQSDYLYKMKEGTLHQKNAYTQSQLNNH
ncbi:peptidase domain-containing ABC transporter [Salibacterium halotolerans]|uniref:ABC-type bacteriocin/lantibiotic exporter, contains an N-terminal double-glycine peptidase domain n=1 Tax=Salibacterium halotolerans TaxID=1884432 RepID=A0A1I5L8W9_9BACI|nr:peptidase domain-containing ABC transporter [Salibacterium halotolerans]SFO93668.1 ABC-type bacteriocin/lantibiotic exporter, contains an N-terminal double-glycine peptidase domain [Salibacterium halotolerans]